MVDYVKSHENMDEIIVSIYGYFHSHGCTPNWMVYQGKYPKWMI